MRFVAVDLETANQRFRSICQVGVVVYEDGREVAAEAHLIDPQEEFSAMNSAIHGIHAENVVGAVRFPEVRSWIEGIVGGGYAICHSPFDRVALLQACDHHGLTPLTCRWIDTVRVARRQWPELERGHGLRTLADHFGIHFRHHDAMEDARAAARIFHLAIEQSGRSVVDWFEYLQIKNRRSNARGAGGSARQAVVSSEDAPLQREVFAFTGSLQMPRSEAANLAALAGADVGNGVTKKTTILVVGDQDLDRFAPGHTKSEKHRKAEDLIAKGQKIRIVQESDFLAFLSTDG